jgi:ABC-type sulfate transport system substrate-binding protein
MSDNTKVKTAYGDTDISKLIKAYESKKKTQEANKEYLRAYFQSEKGKEINLRCAKRYYSENRDEILRKRREKYAKAKEAALENQETETVGA